MAEGGSAGAAGLAQDVEEAYLENPYHNSTHAADVTQGLCAMLACNGFAAALTGPGDAVYGAVPAPSTMWATQVMHPG